MLYDYILKNYEKDEPIFLSELQEIPETTFVRK